RVIVLEADEPLADILAQWPDTKIYKIAVLPVAICLPMTPCQGQALESAVERRLRRRDANVSDADQTARIAEAQSSVERGYRSANVVLVNSDETPMEAVYPRFERYVMA